MQSVPITTNFVSSNPAQADCQWLTTGRGPPWYNWNIVDSGVKLQTLQASGLFVEQEKMYTLIGSKIPILLKAIIYSSKLWWFVLEVKYLYCLKLSFIHPNCGGLYEVLH